MLSPFEKEVLHGGPILVRRAFGPPLAPSCSLCDAGSEPVKRYPTRAMMLPERVVTTWRGKRMLVKKTKPRVVIINSMEKLLSIFGVPYVK